MSGEWQTVSNSKPVVQRKVRVSVIQASNGNASFKTRHYDHNDVKATKLTPSGWATLESKIKSDERHDETVPTSDIKLQSDTEVRVRLQVQVYKTKNDDTSDYTQTQNRTLNFNYKKTVTKDVNGFIDITCLVYHLDSQQPVQGSNGKTIYVDLDEVKTIAGLKQFMAKAEGIAAKDIIVYINGKPFEEDSQRIDIISSLIDHIRIGLREGSSSSFSSSSSVTLQSLKEELMNLHELTKWKPFVNQGNGFDTKKEYRVRFSKDASTTRIVHCTRERLYFNISGTNHVYGSVSASNPSVWTKETKGLISQPSLQLFKLFSVEQRGGTV